MAGTTSQNTAFGSARAFVSHDAVTWREASEGPVVLLIAALGALGLAAAGRGVVRRVVRR
jgi:hypothetical protein